MVVGLVYLHEIISVHVFLIVEGKWNIDDLTQCCHCQQLMKNPVWLPCLDAFCKACLAKSTSCPKCGKVFKKLYEGVPKYKARFLTRVVEMRWMRWVSAVTDARDIQCDLCKFVPNNKSHADYYCMDCHQSLCTDCQCRHPHSPSTNNHKILKFGTELPNDVVQDMRQCRPDCSKCGHAEASWRCYKCKSYLCEQCQRSEHIKPKYHEIQTIKKLLHYSRQPIVKTVTDVKERTSTVTAALDKKKEEIKSETERIKNSVNNIKHQMIDKILLEAKTLNDRADSWCEKQLQSLDEEDSVLRVQRRLIAYAVMLLTNGSITEQLMSLNSLSEQLAELQEAARGRPELIFDKTLVFKPSENLHQLTVGTIEETNRADTADNFGTC